MAGWESQRFIADGESLPAMSALHHAAGYVKLFRSPKCSWNGLLNRLRSPHA